MPSTSTPRMHAARCGASPKKPAAASTTPSDASALADDLRYTGRGVTTVEEHDLWHMPIVLLLLRRPALRGVGVPACRRPAVDDDRTTAVRATSAVCRLAAGVARSRCSRVARRPLAQDFGRAAARAGAHANVSPTTRRARSFGCATRWARVVRSRRSAVGARLPARRLPLPAHPRGHHAHSSRTCDESNILTLDDPELFVVSGRVHVRAGLLDDDEAESSRACAPTCRRAASSSSTTSAGEHWYNFEEQMRRRASRTAAGARSTPAHPIFHSFFDIDHLDDAGLLRPGGVPRHLRGQRSRTSDCWSMANYNHDLGEFWEFSDTGWMPVDLIERGLQVRRELRDLRDDALKSGAESKVGCEVVRVMRVELQGSEEPSSDRADRTSARRYRGNVKDGSGSCARRRRAGRPDERRAATRSSPS